MYKTVSIQRSLVFTSGTPTPIVVDLFGESTITVVNKYSAFRCKSGYKSKGGEQGQNSPFTPVQFTTRICAFKWTKGNPREDYVQCAVESFTVYTCSSYFTLHCRSCKVMYSLRCGQTAMPFGKTGGMAPGFRRRLHRWSETTSFRFVFAQCCYPYVHSRCEKDMKVVVALSSL